MDLRWLVTDVVITVSESPLTNGVFDKYSENVGKLSKAFSFTLFVQMHNFFLNAAILSWLFKILVSKPYRDKFSAFSVEKISTRYGSFANHVSSVSSAASLALCSGKYSSSSFRSSNIRCNTLPRDIHRTSLCNSIFLCSAPISTQSLAKVRVQSGLVLMKLTIFTQDDSTFSNDSSMFLAANASYCIMQWVGVTLGATSLTRATRPDFLPVIDAAPSVHIPTQWSQSICEHAQNSFSTLNTSSPVARVDIAWHIRKSSNISPS